MEFHRRLRTAEHACEHKVLGVYTITQLTFRNRLDTTATSQQVSPKDTDEDRNANHASPPPDEVTNQVDLATLGEQ